MTVTLTRTDLEILLAVLNAETPVESERQKAVRLKIDSLYTDALFEALK